MNMTKPCPAPSSSLPELIARIEGEIPDASRGLPEEIFLFVSRITPLVNVDLLIGNERGETLLTWRADEFHGSGWHVPGGIVRYRELFTARINAVASGELGSEVDFSEQPLAVHEIIHSPGTSRSHFISFLYACTLRSSPDPARRYAGGAIRAGEWAWHEKCPDDIIAAHEIYRRFIDTQTPRVIRETEDNW